ncbi:hypothetical protein DPMN_036985 [Dreissena polymorpha]|uniref:Uncharacterized protein n=1 Tax=Dreissena polymorpha TaxID=45954 RepID=A0A9D4RNN8_DREPO|nr:hypothetical protein DPMN_036985 [Dreissena polymorpha]
MALYKTYPSRASGKKPARRRRILPLVSSHFSRRAPLRPGTAVDRSHTDVADDRGNRTAFGSRRPPEAPGCCTRFEHSKILLSSTQDKFN